MLELSISKMKSAQKSFLRCLLALSIASPAIFPISPATSQVALSALELFYGSQREDNFTTGTDAGRNDAAAANYNYIRVEGCALLRQQQGTVPLYLYYSDARGDNFTTGTQAGINDAVAAGYNRIRVEGYVFPTQQPGTVPLYLYYSDARGDNFTTGTKAGIDSAVAAGYRFVRVEGYAYPRRRCSV